MARSSGRLVAMPSMWHSSSARSERRSASSKRGEGECTMSLASSVS